MPKLNDQELNSIVETVMNRMKQYGSGWEDRNVHDPGVTFVELLAAIKVEQQKNIDTIGTRNLMKFLKLLNIVPKKNSCAITEAVLFPTDDRVIPRGTKIIADDLVFETDQTRKIYANRICFTGNSRQLYDYNPSDLDRSMVVFEENDEDKAFYIGFKKPLSKNSVQLFFQLREEIGRNPVGDYENFSPLSEIRWEYYGTENGELGWHEMKLILDETYGFLFSGNICFSFQGEMNETEMGKERKAFFIRAVNTKYGYEQPPKLSFIMLNSVTLSQKETLCETIEFTYEDFEKNEMSFWSSLAYENHNQLYIKEKDYFNKAEDIDILYLLKESEDGSFRLGTSQRERLFKSFENCHKGDVVFRLVVYSKDFYTKGIIGSSDGTAEQEFEINGIENILYNSFEIMVKSQKGWEIWNKTETLDSCLQDEKSYIFNEQNGVIGFGDNITGKVPYWGKDNICITSCAVTKAEKGRVKAFTLEEFKEKERFSNIKIFHYRSAKGGSDGDSTEKLIKKLRTTVNETQRAVNITDYKEIATRTPGLKLGQVTVIPLYKPGMRGYPEIKAENAITLVVEPYCRVKNKATLEGYVENVRRYVGKFKLITTRLYVTAPVYIPIDVFGEIRVSNKGENTAKLVDKTLRDYIDNVQQNMLGATIYYGTIYNLLEALECTQYIRHLQLDFPVEVVTKNAFGDIQIPPHARVFIRSNQIMLS
ncbi:MAG: baseplate J/gp47 family protein [Lachnospiraceae bacterium]|nr:baseplate J/gp47 family protein [Lachnospiraceae bacterium]